MAFYAKDAHGKLHIARETMNAADVQQLPTGLLQKKEKGTPQHGAMQIYM